MTTRTKAETVEALKDAILHFSEEQVKEFGEHCFKRAETLKKERQEGARREAQAEIDAAMERARARCEAAGIAFVPDLPKKAKAKKQTKQLAALPMFKAHHRYEHPDDPTKVWTSTGVKPSWIKELLAKDRMPVDKGPVRAA
jgi:DNA-binding protein H-NS